MLLSRPRSTRRYQVAVLGPDLHGVGIHSGHIDGGVTWRYIGRPVPDTGLLGNPPALTLLPDRRICLTYGYRSEPFGIRARISADEGVSWGEEIMLRGGAGNHDLGYPRTVLNGNGEIVTAYYYNDDAEGERYIAATIWTPS